MSKAAVRGLRGNISLKYKEPARPSFSRHETFHPRAGWLKKGFDQLAKNPDIFFREDGPTLLGVGKNMAKSMRYWLWAFKLSSDDWKGNKNVQPSPHWLGQSLLSDEGFDPYLESPASLWLLHWNLLKAPCYATTWDYAFNHFREREFSSESLLLSLRAYAEGKFNDSVASETSLKNDISCFIRMYAGHSQQGKFAEETLDCPFVSLGLLSPLPKSKDYSFVYGPKPTLPDEMIVVACMEYAALVNEGETSINLARLLYDVGSPGMVFKIGEREICGAIESISLQNSSISLVESAGRIQLFWKENLESIAKKVLESYYGR